jgi:rod shape determining protein RodA
MREIILHFKKLDWILILIVLLLVGIGLVSIYSSSLARGDFLNFKKQIVFFLFGFFLMILLSFIDWRGIKEEPYLILFFYFICFFGILGLLFLAPKIRGTQHWYKIGFFTIDPIEFLKIVLVLLLAKYFSKRHIEMYKLSHIILSGIYVFLPSIFIFLQPDLGSTLVLISLWIGILIISGIKLRHFLLLCLFAIFIFILSWQFFLKEYQKARIISFFVPIDPLGVSWSQIQAKIAIGNGGIFGQGFAKGSQTKYRFLPEPQTDFIFAAIAEEFGFLGITLLLFLFFILIWRIQRIAFLTQSNFARLFAGGFNILLISQLFINIGMNLGLLPIIGIGLPFVSYGGSALISNFIALGILESIKVHC